MERKLFGKRLLVLGGNPWAESIEDYTKKNGIVLIAAGNSPKSKLFQIADESYVIDSTDIDSMKSFIKEKRIDGVYMGATEQVINKASQYINELGFPCYCTFKQWECLQNKRRFKELCIKHKLPVVPEYSYNEIIQSNDDFFPVVVKPTDGCGSNGFSLCKNTEELEESVKFARDNSPSNTEIIEKYVSNNAICVFYTFSNGIGVFSGSEDKYPIQYSNGSFVGGLYIFRSFEESLFRSKYENRILSLFNEIGIKEGCIWIEIFRDHGDYYFNEIGYRVGGTISIFPVAYMSGINQIATDIYYALTGNSILMKKPNLINYSLPRNRRYCVYTVQVEPGIIVSYEGENDLLNANPNIFKIIKTKVANDVIPDNGSFAQVAALVHFLFDDKNELKDAINDIHEYFRIINSAGQNMMKKRIILEQMEISL